MNLKMHVEIMDVTESCKIIDVSAVDAEEIEIISHTMSLPPAILATMRFLSARDIRSCCQVNKKWRKEAEYLISRRWSISIMQRDMTYNRPDKFYSRKMLDNWSEPKLAIVFAQERLYPLTEQLQELFYFRGWMERFPDNPSNEEICAEFELDFKKDLEKCKKEFINPLKEHLPSNCRLLLLPLFAMLTDLSEDDDKFPLSLLFSSIPGVDIEPFVLLNKDRNEWLMKNNIMAENIGDLHLSGISSNRRIEAKCVLVFGNDEGDLINSTQELFDTTSTQFLREDTKVFGFVVCTHSFVTTCIAFGGDNVRIEYCFIPEFECCARSHLVSFKEQKIREEDRGIAFTFCSDILRINMCNELFPNIRNLWIPSCSISQRSYEHRNSFQCTDCGLVSASINTSVVIFVLMRKGFVETVTL